MSFNVSWKSSRRSFSLDIGVAPWGISGRISAQHGDRSFRSKSARKTSAQELAGFGESGTPALFLKPTRWPGFQIQHLQFVPGLQQTYPSPLARTEKHKKSCRAKGQ